MSARPPWTFRNFYKVRTGLRHCSSNNRTSPPGSTSTSSSNRTPPRIKRHFPLSSYISRLREKYPEVDPASLVGSFLILHELTAIVPLFIGFGTFKYLGVGETVVNWAKTKQRETETDHHSVLEDDSNGEELKTQWIQHKIKDTVGNWIDSGEKRAERVGKRYGIFGYEKEGKTGPNLPTESNDLTGTITNQNLIVSSYNGSDVANAAAAYLVVKVLLPVRLLLSIRLSPVLATVVVKRFTMVRQFGQRYLQKRQA